MSEEEILIDGIPIQYYGTPQSRTHYSKNYNLNIGDTNKMSEEEINKTLDEIFKEDTQNIRKRMKSLINTYDNALNELVENDKTIDKLQKEIEQFEGIKNGTTIIYCGKAKYVREDKIKKYYVDKRDIRDKIKELEDIKNKNIEYCSIDYFRLSRAINVLKEILEE